MLQLALGTSPARLTLVLVDYKGVPPSACWPACHTRRASSLTWTPRALSGHCPPSRPRSDAGNASCPRTRPRTSSPCPHGSGSPAWSSPLTSLPRWLLAIPTSWTHWCA
ncbi:hypothetical protein [Actinomyces lilanjuaniae]|uniref:hypothetical protein n=1 Tax=Actinomyces lilanjuaniae TaxID=2321394 RepID=UPI003C12C0BD